MARSQVVLLAAACLALSCITTTHAKAPQGKAVNGKALFYAPDAKSYLTYTADFGIPICDPRLSNGVAFSVKAAGQAALLKYTFSPNYFGDGAQFSFGAFTGISLHAGTGLLQLESYGAKLSFDLTKLFDADNLQNINRCRDRKTARLANNLFVYNYAAKKSSPVLPNGNAVIAAALDTLTATARQFSKPQPRCSGSPPDPNNGDQGLLMWAAWLVKVRALPTMPVKCS